MPAKNMERNIFHKLVIRWFLFTSLAVFPTGRRINARSALNDNFVICWVELLKSCKPDSGALLPEFECNLKDHEEFPHGQFSAFIHYLNGGSLVKGSNLQNLPHRQLVLELSQALMCPDRGTFQSILLEMAFISESTCFHLQLPGGAVICGCLSTGIANSTLPSITTEDLKEQLPATCEVFLMPHAELEHRPPTPRVHASSGAKTLCAATWNVGREWDKLAEYGIGSGMGLSGLKGLELVSGIRTLLKECGDASIVALGLQEGAEPLLTEKLGRLTEKSPRALVANAFAGVRPWGRNIQSVGDVQGLAEHSAFVTKAAAMNSGKAMVTLTSENLLIFKYDDKSSSITNARPDAIQLDTLEFEVEEYDDIGVHVTGLQFKQSDTEALSCEIIHRSLEAESQYVRNDWALSMRLEQIRARGEVVKEGNMLVHKSEDDVAELRWVLLTTDKLFIMTFDRMSGRPQTAGMEAIQLGDHEFHVKKDGDLCLRATGINSYHLLRGSTSFNAAHHLGRPLMFTSKMCADSFEERETWMHAMRQANLVRAAWDVPKEFMIKYGFVTKISQVFGFSNKRLVHLTSYVLQTYHVDLEFGTPRGPPTNTLGISSVKIEKLDDGKCMTVSGIELELADKVNQNIKYKMCGETIEQGNEWIKAIRLQVARARQRHTYDGYDEDAIGPNGMPTALSLNLQVVGTLGNNSLQDVITKGVYKVFPSMAEAHIIDVHDACRLVDNAYRPAWSVKMNLIGVDIKPSQRLRRTLENELQAIGIRIVDSEISVSLTRESRQPQKNKMAFLPFTNGVSIALFSDTPASEVQLYTVDFAFASGKRKMSFVDALKQEVRKLLPTTADKGGAIVRAVIKGRAFCFAACHLEANKKKKRHQQAQLMSDSLAAIQCDAVIWMGDFNTRPKECCPWKEIELAVAHDLRQHTRNWMWKHDDFSEMVTGFEEMPPLYRPTFHKRFKRTGHDECAAKEFEEAMEANPFLASLTPRSHLLSSKSINDEDAFAAALFVANKHALGNDCGGPSRHTLCWGGDPLRQMCELGKCFNTVDKSHCPGYTDRIIYKGSVLSPLSYWPVESLAQADHTPVVATFQLQLD